MRSFAILPLLISFAAAQSCLNSADHLIFGRCFTLVAQRLTWQEARSWCRSRQSYLATVPDSTTDTFLASYARTTFNDDSGNFWIGLSRNGGKWQWDDGTPLGWTNFESQNENFASESIRNGRWNTFVAETRLNFVCSYYPGEIPTQATAPTPTTSQPPTAAASETTYQESWSTTSDYFTLTS